MCRTPSDVSPVMVRYAVWHDWRREPLGGYAVKLLLAEDDDDTRRTLGTLLREWGYDVIAVADGGAAWDILHGPQAPPLVLLDWIMPALDGVEVCRRVRQRNDAQPPYLILLAGRSAEDDVVTGLDAGADEFVAKPIHWQELQARLRVGQRILQLQASQVARVHQLETALARVKLLQGLLPICMYCKRVRDDHDYWQQVEAYISRHSEAQFSHSICPDCYRTCVQPELEALAAPPGIPLR
jgi:CheY-like chemotaxis protein